MTPAEIEQLWNRVKAMFPNAKISARESDVLEVWQLSKTLREFPSPRRADLTAALKESQFLPSIGEVEKEARRLVPPQRHRRQKCEACDDTGFIHYEETGELHPHDPTVCNIPDCVGSVKWGELLPHPVPCGYCRP
jgi:hypothetical protein